MYTLTSYIFKLLLLLQLFIAICTGQQSVVIRQSRANATSEEGSWEVTRIATVILNADYTLYCMIEGGQSTSLRWVAVNNFTAVSQQTIEGGQLLILTSTQRSQIGEYICRDTVGSSDTRLLLTEDDPGLMAAQSTVVVESGQYTNLVVYVSTLYGLNSISIVWERDGSQIASNEGESDNLFDLGKRLTFNSVGLSDAGTYNVTASRFTSTYLSTKTVSISLTVYERPVVITQPVANLVVDEWHMVQLECRFGGNPTPQVTWQRDSGTISGLITSNIDNEGIVSTLTFDRISSAEAGQYWCRASNEIAPSTIVTSNPSIISVAPRLLLFQDTNALALIEESLLIVQPLRQITLLCRASASPRWYTAGRLVSMSTSDQVYQDQVNSTTQRLIIRPYRDLLRVEYTCMSVEQQLERSVTLTTENPSVSSDNDTFLYARSGSTIHLVVYVFGIPEPRADQILWYQNDTLITQSAPFTLSHDHLSLTISNIGTQYYGVYQCNVTTDNGTSSQFFTIERPFSPSAEIVGPTEDVTVGSNVHFTCNVLQGTEPISINWIFEDQVGLPDGVQVKNDVLEFTSVEPRHSGVYICNVTNSWGYDEHYATLNVLERPSVSVWIQSGSMNTSSSSLQLASGSDAPVLICSATGNPLPQVHWTYQGGDLPNGVIVNSLGNRVMLTWSRPLNYMDTGLYRCEGINTVNIDVATINLTVTVATTAPRPNSEIFIQLRMLSLSCSHWNVSHELEEFTLKQIYIAILNGLKSQCDCNLDDNNLISDSLSCSGVVDSSTLYKAGLATIGDYNASDVLSILTDWLKHDPYITVNNTQYKIDTSCEIVVDPNNQWECNGASSDDDSNSSDNNIVLYGAGLGAVVVVCVLVLFIGLLVCICKRCHKPLVDFSRPNRKKIANTVYISNSFQALNQLGQSNCQQSQANNNRTNEEQNLPHHYESIHAFNPIYDLPNEPRRVDESEQSPRLSSDSRLTTDSGIQGSIHSCDQLMARPSRSDVTPQLSTHRPLGHANSEEIRLSPLHDEPSQLANFQTPMKRKQPSFDEIRYLSGVEIIDNQNQLRSPYYTSEHISHSQPLEMLDYPDHKYAFSEQRASYSQTDLSQSHPNASHLQHSKQVPEPYTEPISFRSSLHSILKQSSQLDTMV